MSEARREAVRRVLEQRYGTAVPVTEEMIDAIIASAQPEGIRQAEVTDGHRPDFTVDPALGHVIGCECGWRPAKRAQRASMQHVPHMAHRRKLGLARILDYVGDWSR